PATCARPKASPRCRTSGTTPKRRSPESVKLMNPGPAMSARRMASLGGSAATIASAASRGLRPTRFASWRATFVAKSPCSALRGRSSSIGQSPACGKARCTASARSPARRAFGSAAEGFKASSKTPNYTGPTRSDLLGVDVQGPADPPLPADQQLGAPLSEERLERGPRPRAHQELGALEARSPLEGWRHRVEDLYPRGEGSSQCRG